MKRWGWLVLGLMIIACNFLTHPSLVTSTPTPAPTSTSTSKLTPRPGWQAFHEGGVELQFPENWERLPEFEQSPDASTPASTLIIADTSGDVQMSFYCMPKTGFAQFFGETPTTPSQAGEILWEVMLAYFDSLGQADGLLAETLEEFTVNDAPAVQVSFTSLGVAERLGVENPMELAEPVTIYYKILAVVMEARNLCYIVVTARSQESREQADIDAIINSLRLTP